MFRNFSKRWLLILLLIPLLYPIWHDLIDDPQILSQMKKEIQNLPKYPEAINGSPACQRDLYVGLSCKSYFDLKTNDIRDTNVERFYSANVDSTWTRKDPQWHGGILILNKTFEFKSLFINTRKISMTMSLDLNKNRRLDVLIDTNP